MRRVHAFIARSLSLLVVTLTACASNDIQWTEEVKLSDGRVVRLERRVELTSSGFPVQQRGFRKYVEICYAPMNLRWKSTGAYVPDIFDIVDGKAYMHVPVSGCVECAAQGYPDPNALHFVWESQAWRRIAYEQFPKASQWNLLMSFVSPGGYEKNDPRGLVTLADKERRPSSMSREQKRLGWKRLNESPALRDACKKCGSTRSNIDVRGASDMFINDGLTSCRR